MIKNTIYSEYFGSGVKIRDIQKFSDLVQKYEIIRIYGSGINIRDILNFRIGYKNTRYSEFSDPV